jgi:ABC-type amino acid transport substrate-binding protein
VAGFAGLAIPRALELRLDTHHQNAQQGLARRMSGRIFISYRREDSAGHAGRVKDRFEREFGRDLVFMDVDNIDLGENFVDKLRMAVAECQILLAVIGRNWLDMRDEAGNRRLDDVNDFVRIEIATALQRRIPVIPILLDGTAPPRADRLPEDLKELSVRNALNVRHDSFDGDIERLFKSVRRRLDGLPPPATTAKDAPPAPPPPIPPEPIPVPAPLVATIGRRWTYAALAVVAVAIAVSLIVWQWRGRPGDDAALLPAPIWDLAESSYLGQHIPFRWTFDPGAAGGVRANMARGPTLFELSHARDPDFKDDVTRYTYVAGDHRDVRSINATRYWKVRAVIDTADADKPPLSRWSDARQVTQYNSAYDRIMDRGAILLYVSDSDNQGIFKWVDGKGTRGFDLKLADAIRAELSGRMSRPLRPVQAISVKWDTLLDRPAKGDADIIIASVTKTPERKHKHGIDFSETYYCTSYAFMRREREADRPIAEMIAGRIVGVQKDTTGADLVAQLRKEKTFEIKVYPNTEAISGDIISSKIDFAVTDTPFAMAEELKHKMAGRNRVVYKEFKKDDFPASFPAEQQFQEYAVVARDGDDRLLSAIDAAIGKAKQDGSMARFLSEAMVEFEDSNSLKPDARSSSTVGEHPWACPK